MVKLSTLLSVLNESLENSTPKEVVRACELIVAVQDMPQDMRDCLRGAYLNGPITDGEVVSKESRNNLVELGYLARVVIRGQDGYNACTNKGAWAYRILEAESDSATKSPGPSLDFLDAITALRGMFEGLKCAPYEVVANPKLGGYTQSKTNSSTFPTGYVSRKGDGDREPFHGVTLIPLPYTNSLGEPLYLKVIYSEQGALCPTLP